MLTKEQALTCNVFYHITARYRDGGAYQARRNGKTRTWKREPERFSVPCKVGFKGYLRISSGFNAHEWCPTDPTKTVLENTMTPIWGDWESMLVYSDWLEEHDRIPEAVTMRWMVKHKRRPWGFDYQGKTVDANWDDLSTKSVKTWRWWESPFSSGWGHRTDSNCLPKILLQTVDSDPKAIRKWRKWEIENWRGFLTLESAYEQLLKAASKHPETFLRECSE